MDDLLTNVTCGAIDSLARVLPESPLQSIDFGNVPEQAIGWINWVMPIGRMRDFLAMWVASLTVVTLGSKFKGILGTLVKLVLE